MKLTIRTYPDPVLKEKSSLVSIFDERLQNIATSMVQFMQKFNGIGLAAPQIGISERIIVVDVGQKPLYIVNPEITESKGKDIFEEGCLSIPGAFIQIKRPFRVDVRGYDINGKEIHIKAKDLLARVIQHEIDHLNGRLIIDFLSREERLKFNLNYNPTLPAYEVKERRDV
ncbi:MAG: peptide deformylase [candidate division WOR-3 bacterium]|nr:peptide deformylase [candidate division WOR-3 bacterium]